MLQDRNGINVFMCHRRKGKQVDANGTRKILGFSKHFTTTLITIELEKDVKGKC